MTQDAQLTIDTEALRRNVGVLRAEVAPVQVMTVVKADGYGHGAVPAALAFEQAGVDWLGVVDLDEAVELREGGVTLPVLAWLHAPGETFERAAEYAITPAVSDLAQLDAAAAAGVPAIHLCIDTGLGRNGAVESEWPELFDRCARLSEAGVEIQGVMSHLSNTSPADDGLQMSSFVRAIGLLVERGVRPPLRHLAASAGALSFTGARISMVRFGLAAYGLSPFADRSSADLGLRPALTLSAPVIRVMHVRAGEGTSYGFTWRAKRDTRVAIVPVGYADGIERVAGNRASVLLGGRLRPVVGRIAMNSMAVEIGAGGLSGDCVEPGDIAVLFGAPSEGHPSVEAWAEATGTINYEVIARLSARLPRRYR